MSRSMEIHFYRDVIRFRYFSRRIKGFELKLTSVKKFKKFFAPIIKKDYA